MAQSGPILTPTELSALIDYVRLFQRASSAPRQSDVLPSQRWSHFEPRVAASRLPGRLPSFLQRYRWHREGPSSAANAIVQELVATLERAAFEISEYDLDSALIAGSHFLVAPGHPLHNDDSALAAFEKFTEFVNGYAATLPPRFSPLEGADDRNRRFRAFQRRFFGDDIQPRAPRALIKRLPDVTRDLVDEYTSQLLADSVEGTDLIAHEIAVSLARPVDALFIAQLDVALAVAVVWSVMPDFPSGVDSHALIGYRSENAPSVWDAALDRLTRAQRMIISSSPQLSLQAARHCAPPVVIDNIELDVEAINSLSLLDDYVNSFDGWIRVGQGVDLSPEDRVNTFDRVYRKREASVRVTGADIVGGLPPSAVKLMAHCSALVARNSTTSDVAQDLALVLGDRTATPRVERTIEVAVAWLNGLQSSVEPAPNAPSPRDDVVDAVVDIEGELDLFALASAEDTRMLVGFGTHVAELVRVSRANDSGTTPPDWWTAFHNHDLDSETLGPDQLVGLLPANAVKLVRRYTHVLASDTPSDLRLAVRKLANTLGRGDTPAVVAVLAVALSTASIWLNADEISRGHRSDTILGVDTSSIKDRLIVARAQSQLEWGLQQILGADIIPGV